MLYKLFQEGLFVMHDFFKTWFLCLCLFTVNDTLDEIFDDSDDEEESHDIVSQVLDEIGIEISGKVRTETLHGHQSNHVEAHVDLITVVH